MKKLHFIAIGGAAMHNLALAMHANGFIITGSDDEIAEPSLSRLKESGLLPQEMGWFPEKIHAGLDGIILGMHARNDNAELQRAIELGIPVFSFPEYLFEHSKNKLRVVIGGSHGKTTITAMILHVLNDMNVAFDYMVGAKIDGFDTMVRLSNAPLIILEGDEYLSSPIDRRPKFHLYKADIGVISGIAWDHINVFPTFDNYLEQFKIFAEEIPVNGCLIYCSDDENVNAIAADSNITAEKIAYSLPSNKIADGTTYLLTPTGDIPLQIFGDHNLRNLEAAHFVCEKLGIGSEHFFNSIKNFKGAARRLELIGKSKTAVVYKDFAHSPSKLQATIHAVRNQYPDRKLIACMELHTFSSLNENFINLYSGTMDEADYAFVYFNPHTVEHKKLNPITTDSLFHAFKNPSLKIYNDSNMLKNDLLRLSGENCVYLLMSSGTFDGMNLTDLATQLTQQKNITQKI